MGSQTFYGFGGSSADCGSFAQRAELLQGTSLVESHPACEGSVLRFRCRKPSFMPEGVRASFLFRIF